MPLRYGRSFTKYSGLRSSSIICPRVYSFSLNGPVPTQRWRSSASGTWAGYTGEYPDASIRINEGWGRLSRKITVWASGASMASTLAYQSFRGLKRSLAGASLASRTTSKVYLTSAEENGFPSCHFTFLRRKRTRLR